LFGGLMLSNSRAGFAATVVGCIVVSLLLLRGRWPSSRGTRWVIPAGVVVLAVLVVITGSAFFSKLGGLSEGDLLNRFRIWELSFRALMQSPWLGWGLGTYADVYTMLQAPDFALPNDKAHSTPLQWMVEFGVPAALCAFAVILVPLVVCLRGSVRRRTDRHLPAIALAAPLVTIVHSLVDFSLEMPAIGLLVSMLLGMGWAQAFRRYE
jgi:O-antigen ligase